MVIPPLLGRRAGVGRPVHPVSGSIHETLGHRLRRSCCDRTTRVRTFATGQEAPCTIRLESKGQLPRLFRRLCLMPAVSGCS